MFMFAFWPSIAAVLILLLILTLMNVRGVLAASLASAFHRRRSRRAWSPAAVVVAVLGLALAGCANMAPVVPKTPAQAVFALEGSLTVAMRQATTYARLPRCVDGAAVSVCSDAHIVLMMQAAAPAAVALVIQAEGVVTDPAASGADQAAAAAKASAAVASLLALIPPAR